MKLFSQYKGLRRENYIFFFGRIVTNLGSMIWPVLTLILNQKMGLSAANVALVMIIAGAVQMPLGLIGGKIADKYNKKNIIVLFDAIAISFYIMCAFIPLSWVSLGVLLLASTLQSMEGPAYNALIADITPTKDRERAYSLAYLGTNIGLVASPTIAGLLFQNHLEISFLISGIAIGISTVLIFFFVKDITPAKEDDEKSSAYQKSAEQDNVLTILKENKVMMFYIIIMAFYWAAYNQYAYLMPMDMARVHGEQGALIYGSVSSLNCIVVVICTPVITALLSKVCYTKKNLISIFFILIGYLVFLIGLGTIPFYYVAIVLFTWGEILCTTVSGPYLAERTPASHRGRINSIQGLMQSIIVGIAMYASGVLFDYFGSTVAWIFVFCLLGIALLGSIVLIPIDKKAYKDLY